MSSDFAGLIADIEREAYEEGSRAVRELEWFRTEFGQAGTRLGGVPTVGSEGHTADAEAAVWGSATSSR
jgi:hypothetical protein